MGTGRLSLGLQKYGSCIACVYVGVINLPPVQAGKEGASAGQATVLLPTRYDHPQPPLGDARVLSPCYIALVRGIACIGTRQLAPTCLQS